MVWQSRKDRADWLGHYPKVADWKNLVPHDVAISQRSWELDAMMIRIKEHTGWSYKKIGEGFNLSLETIRIRCIRGKRNKGRRSPVELYLSKMEADLKPMVFEITCNGEKHDQP